MSPSLCTEAAKGRFCWNVFPAKFAGPGLAASEGWLGTIQLHLAAFRWLIVSDDQPPAATSHRARARSNFCDRQSLEICGEASCSLGHRCVNKCILSKPFISYTNWTIDHQHMMTGDWRGQNSEHTHLTLHIFCLNLTNIHDFLDKFWRVERKKFCKCWQKEHSLFFLSVQEFKENILRVRLRLSVNQGSSILTLILWYDVLYTQYLEKVTTYEDLFMQGIRGGDNLFKCACVLKSLC